MQVSSLPFFVPSLAFRWNHNPSQQLACNLRETLTQRHSVKLCPDFWSTESVIDVCSLKTPSIFFLSEGCHLLSRSRKPTQAALDATLVPPLTTEWLGRVITGLSGLYTRVLSGSWHWRGSFSKLEWWNHHPWLTVHTGSSSDTFPPLARVV